MSESCRRKSGRHQRIHERHAQNALRIQHGGAHGNLSPEAVPDKHCLFDRSIIKHAHQIGRMRFKRPLLTRLARAVPPQIQTNDPPTVAKRRLLHKLLPATGIGSYAMNEDDRPRAPAAAAVRHRITQHAVGERNLPAFLSFD